MDAELEAKLAKIQVLLSERALDALLIQNVTNFAWITGGASSYVNTADNLGTASLLITPSRRYLITNNIEAPRLRQEEALDCQGWEFKISPWYEAVDTTAQLAHGLRLGADCHYPGAQDLSADLIRLRTDLLPEEQDRFRELCQGCAQAMQATVASLKPGMTEFEIAAILGEQAQRRELLPVVNLIATDERVYAYRHPLPTAKKLDRYAMLVLCGRKHGLVASLTRLVHFGAMPVDLCRKAQAVAEIDAALITATRPGRSLGEIFQIAQAKYAQLGFPDEWRLHHQGGPAGYLPREAFATPGSELVVKIGQVYAWNPSLTGTKSEDSIIVEKDGVDILTEIHGWPNLSIEVDGQCVPRPATLVLD
jgi:Xaa-Pro aminopeptidase